MRRVCNPWSRGRGVERAAAVAALAGTAVLLAAATPLAAGTLATPVPATPRALAPPQVARAAEGNPAVRPPRRRLWSEFQWPRTSPEAQGVDGAVVASFRERTGAGEFGPVHSLVIVRHGVLIEESYFGGWRASDLHVVYSVTKSVTALLYGIGLERGLLPPPETRVVPLFRQYPTVDNAVPSKDRITVEDLLTMRAGLDWNEGSVSYLDPSNAFLRMEHSADWFKYVLDRPMEDEPGTTFRYNSGASLLLGGIIHGATGQQPASLAREWLFRPLDIGSWRWSAAVPAVSNTASGLSLLPLDMAKIGQLLLDDGAWGGVQVVPAAWVRGIRAQHAVLTQNFGYGEQWWIMPLRPELPAAVAGNEIWLAWGFGGQYIFVVPALDTVVVSTAGCYDETCSGAMSFVQALLSSAIK